MGLSTMVVAWVPADVPVHVDPALLALVLSPWVRVAAFVWGALWGSFANVVIYRVPRGMSILRPRSRCSHCETPIAAYDNIPIVSYLLRRGRCRHCAEPYSARYMVVELLCGVLSFALWMQYVHLPLVEGGGFDWVPWLAYFAFGLALVVVTYVDLDCWSIPDVVVLPMAVVGLLLAWLVPDALEVGIVESAVAAGVGFLLFAGIRQLYLWLRGMEALGLGDAKLLLMVGAFTGLEGLFWTIGAGALQGLLISVPLLAVGKRVANTDLMDVHGDDPELGEEDPDAGISGQRVPFGPFLALAAMEFVLLRPHIRELFAWASGVP